jgi:protein ImuB
VVTAAAPEPVVRTLCVWCPDWPVAVLDDAGSDPRDPRVAADPGAAPPPLVVLERGRVLAAAEAARLEGVRRGMRRREAEARCPEARVVERDPVREARRFEEVVRALDAVAPKVAIDRPGVCSLPTRGPARYFGGDRALAERVAALLGEHGIAGARVGVADGAFAARLAARRAEPGGSFVVAAGTAPAFLASWPVDVLDTWLDDWQTAASGSAGDALPGPARELTGLFERLGLRTLGDLAALPAPAVTARFGPVGQVAHRLARGLDAAPLVLVEAPPDLVAVEHFDPPATEVEPVVFRCRALAERFLADLGERGLACTQVRLEARTEEGDVLARSWRHDGPLTPHALGERLRWQLDGWLTDRARAQTGRQPRDGMDVSGGLVALHIAPDELVAATGRQLGIWGGDQHAADRATRALVRIQGLLGHDAVATARLQGGRTPGEQVRWVPWGEAPDTPTDGAPAGARAGGARATGRAGGARTTGGRAGGARAGGGWAGGGWAGGGRAGGEPWPGAVPSPSPALLFDPPVPAELLDDAGRPLLVDGRGEPTGAPGHLRSPALAGGGGPVAVWAGPWVHDLRWWDPATRRRRTLWQIATADTVCLVALERQTAVIEAIYD